MYVFKNLIKTVIIKCIIVCLTYVDTWDEDCDVSTAYCLSSSGDEVDWLRGTIYITKVYCDWCILILHCSIALHCVISWAFSPEED